MPRPIVHLIAHTHWDREWYLPLGALRARLVPMIDGLLAQLETDARLASFLLDGQTILLEDYLILRPEQRERVAALVQAGRLVTGPWYVLADEQIPAAESLIRNLLIGRTHQRALGAPEHGVLYSPDAFGHPAVLPALAAEAGLADAVVWRGLSSEQARGGDLAWWEAPDGRRVLVYHLPPDGYEIGAGLLVPDGALAAAWARVRERVLPRAATRHVALFVGADHHAPDPELGGLAARLAAVDASVEFRSSSLASYFRAARGDLGDLPLLAGDLRWSYGYTWTLQGVHATRAPLKRRNSRAELWLTRMAEPLAALAPHPGEAAVLRQAWREVVPCHFHDTIGGCCADPVAAAMATRLEDAERAAQEVATMTLRRLAGHDADRARDGAPTEPMLLLWNPVARPRHGVVLAEVTGFRADVLVGPPGDRTARRGRGMSAFQLGWTAADGSLLRVAPQVLERSVRLDRVDASRHYPDQDEVESVRVAFPLPEALEPLAGRLLTIVPGAGQPLEPFAQAQGRLLWNGRAELAVDADGTAVLQAPGAAAPLPGLLALESELDRGDCYTFCPVRGDRARRPARAGRVRVSAPGPFVAGLEWTLAMPAGRAAGGGPGRVAGRVRVEAVGDSPVLRVRLALDNRANDHRLRLRFPTGLRGVGVLAGAQFGTASRAAPARRAGRYPAETPVPTAPAHRWVAAAAGARGLALFAPGFFEYEWTARGDLLLTLLRAVGELSRDDLATRRGHAGWPTPTPGAQCEGREEIELGLAAVTEEDLRAPERLERWWEDAFLPPAAVFMRDYCATEVPLLDAHPVALVGEGLVFTAMKPAEDGSGYILRCVNLRDEATEGAWRWATAPGRVTRVRADETALAPLTCEGTELRFEVGPREVWSFRVSPV